MKVVWLVGLLMVSGGCKKSTPEENEEPLPQADAGEQVDAGEEPDAGQQTETTTIDASAEPAYRCGDLSEAFGLAYQLSEANIAHGGTVPPNPYNVDPYAWLECLTRFRSCQMSVSQYSNYAPNGPRGWWTDTATEKELKACAPNAPGYDGAWQTGLFDAFLAAERTHERCYHSEAGPDSTCPAGYEDRWLGDGLPEDVQIVNQTPWP